MTKTDIILYICSVLCSLALGGNIGFSRGFRKGFEKSKETSLKTIRLLYEEFKKSGNEGLFNNAVNKVYGNNIQKLWKKEEEHNNDNN